MYKLKIKSILLLKKAHMIIKKLKLIYSHINLKLLN